MNDHINHSCAEVAILMATYNGAKYVGQQIDSILSQNYSGWHLYIRDDGSSDDTVRIIEDYAKGDRRITVIHDDFGNLGYNKNFYRILGLVNESYIAFCDQDDIWLPEKLQVMLDAMAALEIDYDGPGLVHSEVKIVDKNLVVIKDQFIGARGHAKGASGMVFANAVQGAAMMINRKLADVALPVPPSLPFDYHIALICEFVGRRFFIDRPLALYRQHANNAIGVKKKRDKEFYTESLIASLGVYSHIFGELSIFSADKQGIHDYKVLFESRNPLRRVWFFLQGRYFFSQRKDWLIMLILLLLNKDLHKERNAYVRRHYSGR